MFKQCSYADRVFLFSFTGAIDLIEELGALKFRDRFFKQKVNEVLKLYSDL